MAPAPHQASVVAGGAPAGPDPAELGLCVHCGFCLNVCPTYLALGVEMDSPRGRIAFMRALQDERVDLTPRIERHFAECLQWRACETACPSGVPYGRLIAATRAGLFAAHARRPDLRARLRRAAWRVAMRGVFSHPARLRRAFAVLRLYQRTGLQGLVRRSGLLRLLPSRLADADALTPDLSRPFFSATEIARIAPRGDPRAHVAFLTGCIMPLAFPETHRASVRVLARNGVAVDAPAAQRCCGALHAHGGDAQEARRLARASIDAFLPVGQPEPDAIVVNAAGCGAQMKEYGHLLRDDPAYAGRAAHFGALVRDVLEYLHDLGIDAPTGRIERTVTYQDSCRLLHAQKVGAAPRALLRLIPGLDLREMDHPERCCGSAGLYSLVQPRLSRAVLADKMAEIHATGVEQVCTANPGCMLQLDAGLRRFPGTVPADRRTAHVVDLLDESYRAGDSST